ncbi:uncharacterized protein LOC141731332 isoform X2 [Zonotrichia albicollis]|uniref:uncharacterized protein LOC141731332 isoform X2 n=1 Tax=Zonotrichia albicollis TaxID=44394 RepID=UPI003D80D48B
MTKPSQRCLARTGAGFGTDGSIPVPGLRGWMRGWSRAARRGCAAFREDEEPRAAAAEPRTGASASPRSARAPLPKAPGAAPGPPRHWPRPPSLTHPVPGTPDGAGAARSRSHLGDRSARQPRPGCAAFRPHGPPRAGRAARGNGAAAPPEPPPCVPPAAAGARCPAPGAAPGPPPAAPSACSAPARPAQPLCVRARGCKWRPAGTRQRRHRAAPGGTDRHQSARERCGAPRPPHRPSQPGWLRAARSAPLPAPLPGLPACGSRHSLTGGELRALPPSRGERAGGGCGIPGPASGLAVPAGAAPLLPQPCEPERHRNKSILQRRCDIFFSLLGSVIF